MIKLTTISVLRKDLNEQVDFNFDIKNETDTQAVSPDDEAILELLSEIIKGSNARKE